MRHKLFVFNLLFILLVGFSFQSCKKDPKPNVEDNTPPAGGTRAEQTLDSIFLYAKQVYLWNDELPNYKQFEPRQYSSPNSELFAITQIPINPKSGKPYEFSNGSSPKYSYLTDDDNPGGSLAFAKRSDISLEGDGFDFGFNWVNLRVVSENRNYLFIRSVETNSPADKAGLKRGDQITRVNDRTVNLTSQSGLDQVNDAMLQARIKLEGTRGDGSSFTRTFDKTSYTSNPVYKKTIIPVGSKKVGYLAYARFSELESNSQAVLDEAFQEFAAGGVTELVIDLRYNGGGYVTTAEHLSNLIAPSSLHGKVMFVERYNDLMRSGKAEILKNQFFETNSGTRSYADINYAAPGFTTTNFAKKGSLQNIQNVYFLVSKNSASASELVVNSLKAHINVTLIGETTYGKPVGFFPLEIGGYTVYLSMFESRNAKNEGEYFTGMKVDYETFDDVTKDFGDSREASLAQALALIGGVPATASKQMSIKSGALMSTPRVSDVEVDPIGKDTEFKGMIEDRFKNKIKN
jgi:carboxyl-terminal processing protease